MQINRYLTGLPKLSIPPVLFDNYVYNIYVAGHHPSLNTIPHTCKYLTLDLYKHGGSVTLYKAMSTAETTLSDFTKST